MCLYPVTYDIVMIDLQHICIYFKLEAKTMTHCSGWRCKVINILVIIMRHMLCLFSHQYSCIFFK